MSEFPLSDKEPMSEEVTIIQNRDLLKLAHSYAESKSRLFSEGHIVISSLATTENVPIKGEPVNDLSIGVALYESLTCGFREIETVDDALLVRELLGNFRKDVLGSTYPAGMMDDMQKHFAESCPSFHSALSEVAEVHAPKGVIYAMAGAACMWSLHAEYERVK